MLKIDKVLTQKMDRKQFITAMGVVVVSAVGIPSLIKSLHQLSETNGQDSKRSNLPTSGYGASRYNT
jgi:hypothetical protein